MTSYKATAEREDGWWVVDVEGVGVTQGHTTAEAHRMAVDLVHAVNDEPADHIKIDIEFRLSGGMRRAS